MQFRTVYHNRVKRDPRFSRLVRESTSLYLSKSVESDPSSGIEEILGWPIDAEIISDLL
jgi:hypothetical protein